MQPANPAFRAIHERLVRLQVLEELRQFLAPLRLPRKLTVRVEQCGAATRPFKPQGPAVVCYELIDQIEKFAAKANENSREIIIVGTFVQAVFHEVAEAIFDILQAPVWGRAEDAADRLAAFLMLQFGEEAGAQDHRRDGDLLCAVEPHLDRQRVRQRGVAGGAALFQLPLHRLWRGAQVVRISGEGREGQVAAAARRSRAAVSQASMRRSARPSICGSCPTSIPDMLVRARAIDWKLSAD